MADKNKHDEGVMFALIVFVVVLICIVFWFAMSAQISSGIRWLRVAELQLASLFTDKYDAIIRQIMDMDPDHIRPIHLLYMSEAAGEFMRIPIAVLLSLMAVKAFFQKSKHPYARRLNLEAMAKEHATAFPVTSPIVKFNPLKANARAPGSPVPEKLPPFAEALTPEEWVAHNSIPVTDGAIDRDASRMALAKQLGGRWKGVNQLPMYMKALFVAFSMKANGLRTESDDYLGELAQCWQPGKGLVLTPKLRKEIKEKIADPKFGRITEKVAALHSFVTPALLRCLLMAREQGGVLASAQFVWLRAVDRHLWYAMNNLGRGAVHPESAGAISHYRAEKSAGKPIPNPQVEQAIDGIIEYLKENYITQFPAKEYASAKSARKK
jgi:intracellular multiplication protein IcmP